MARYPKEYSTTGPLSTLYRTWYDMNRRCSPKANRHCRKNYYLKGIRVCSEWGYWPTFAEWALSVGWAKGLEIDRIDNSKNYNPDNCRFATRLEQNRNRNLAEVNLAIKKATTKFHAKPFVCVETGQLFETQIEASRVTGVERRSIARALKGEFKQAGGYRWRYMEAS